MRPGIAMIAGEFLIGVAQTVFLVNRGPLSLAKEGPF